jgi:CRP-like cAMP-binding protein
MLVKIPRASVLRKLSTEPEFGQAYINVLVQRVREYEELLVQHVSETGDQRLARVLTRLARFGEWLDRNTVILPRLTHVMLSEMVGTTRPRTTFFVGKLRRMGILRSGSVLCINVQRLLAEIVQQHSS